MIQVLFSRFYNPSMSVPRQQVDIIYNSYQAPLLPSGMNVAEAASACFLYRAQLDTEGWAMFKESGRESKPKQWLRNAKKQRTLKGRNACICDDEWYIKLVAHTPRKPNAKTSRKQRKSNGPQRR